MLHRATLGSIPLANRTVVAPMTRDRATASHVPTPIMAEYYAQRAAAGSSCRSCARAAHRTWLNTPDFATFHTPGEKGYTDYPLAAASVAAP